MIVTYFYGCFVLPYVLTLLDFEFLKLGEVVISSSKHNETEYPAVGTKEEEASKVARSGPECGREGGTTNNIAAGEPPSPCDCEDFEKSEIESI